MVQSTRTKKVLVCGALFVVPPFLLIYGWTLTGNPFFYRVGYVFKEIGETLIMLEAILLFYAWYYFNSEKKITAKELYETFMLKSKLDKAFVDIHAYIPTRSERFVQTPKVKIHQDSLFIDFLGSPTIQEQLIKHKDTLSTALPEGWVIEEMKMDPSQDHLCISFSNFIMRQKEVLSASKMLTYADSDPNELTIDKNHVVNLKQHPGFLITGGTGSGKTYGTRYLIIQGLMKRHDVVVCDIKKTYQSLSPYVEFYFDPDSIIRELERVCIELEIRELYLDPYLRTNPDVCAVDVGIPIKLVVIEEYLALMAMLTPAQKKQVNALVTRIVATGRQLSIHLVIVMQVSSADQLDSSIRSNLPVKLVYGSANETIYKTTFGLSEVPKINYDLKTGQGLAMMENHRFLFQTPKMDFKLEELGLKKKRTQEEEP